MTSERTAAGAAESRKRAATGLIETHDAVFRRTARRYSICADDAEDAYQRALEILLTKAPPIEGDNLVRWMQTVTKREALGVRRQRERLLGAPRPLAEEDDRDPLDSIASERPAPEDRAASRERVLRTNEALRALKPQEVRALTLKAEGYSYAEIGEITGWSYTKINRCMAEGRKRFLEAFDELEHGDHCERLARSLSALADGEPGLDGAEEVQLHLRSCGACRAKLRAFRGVPERVLELLPTGPAIETSSGGRVSEWMGERLGAAIEKGRELGYAAISRGAGDGASAPLLSSGGTRGAGMAALGKVLAVCGATAAGSAACVAGGVVDAGALGVGSGASDRAPALTKPERPVEAPLNRDDATAGTVTAPASADPATEAEAATPEPAPTPAQQAGVQFGFEAAAAPAPAPSGGGEFGAPSGGGGSGGGGSGGGGGGFGFER